LAQAALAQTPADPVHHQNAILSFLPGKEELLRPTRSTS